MYCPKRAKIKNKSINMPCLFPCQIDAKNVITNKNKIYNTFILIMLRLKRKLEKKSERIVEIRSKIDNMPIGNFFIKSLY